MSRLPIRRTFLGWNKSLLQGTLDHLIAGQKQMDFSGTLLVVSGGRAGRRMLALLAERAIADQKVLVPPMILTAGALPEKLYASTANAASPLARQMAWVGALQKVEPSIVQQIFPRLESSTELAPYSAAARLLDRCSQELAAGMLDFSALATRAEGSELFGQVDRWQAAAAIQQAFWDQLESAGLTDTQRERAEAISNGEIRATGPILLAGVAELTPQLRAMLKSAAENGGDITVLVFAPQNLADAFDDFGCVRSDGWENHSIDPAAVNLRIAQKMTQQAEQAFAAVADAGAGLRTDQFTIGLGDESLVPNLETVASNLADVPVRYGAGRPLISTRPCQLLLLASRYLQSRRFADFSALVRHSDVEQFLFRPVSKTDEPIRRDWRTLLDQYAGSFLPDRLGPASLTIDGWRGEAPADEDEPDDRVHLAWLYGRVMQLLGALVESDANVRQTPATWAEGILSLLHRVYGQAGTWNQNDEGDRLVVMACQDLRDLLGELHDLPANGSIEVAAWEAVGLVLSLAANGRIAPPLKGTEIEMVGWLELLADDADYLVVTGFNEGCIPEPVSTDAFLTDSLRRELGLNSERDRFARDAYILAAIVGSRPVGKVTLIAGQKSADGDPLLPSRLLFRGGAVEVANRLLQVLKPSPRPKLAYRFGPGQVSRFPLGAKIPESIPDITSMRVTSFRDYLSSPQGFYLQHVLRLKTIIDSAPRELDPAQCGNIVHAVLNAFAICSASSSQSHQQCQDAMMELLDRQIAAQFGQSSLPGAVRFQTELIRKRLLKLGEWQAQWARDGWRIRHAEWQSPGQPNLAVDGSPMYLRGRIDRIDYHESSKEWAVLDYKVATGEKKPETAHYSGGQWRDLQLPLYRHLAAEIIGEQQPKLGYIVVSDRDENIGVSLASWGADELTEADHTAGEVVRKIRRKEYSEMGDNPPAFGMFAHIFGEGLLASTDAASEEAEQ